MPEVDMKLVADLEDKVIDIKKQLFDMTYHIGIAHLGGSLSLCDMAVALYYSGFLKFDPKNPKLPDRDRLILSKGHTACLFYNILSDLGFYPRENLLTGYNKIEGKFGQHPNRKYVPGIEASTGSLGHGLSIATGMAMAGRMDKAGWRVFCITGDGELNEGLIWEGVMMAAKYQLGNLVLIVDVNKYSGGGPTSVVMPMEPLEDKFKAFNWDVVRIDGHNMEAIVKALSSLPPSDSVIRRKPICILSDTMKGHGIPWMENTAIWHLGGLDSDKVEECCAIVESQRKVRG